MDKRFIVFIVISVAVLYFSNYFTMQKARQKRTDFIQTETKATETNTIQENHESELETKKETTNKQEMLYNFENEYLKLVASNIGGVVKSLTLKAKIKSKTEEIKFITPNELNNNFLFEYGFNNAKIQAKQQKWDLSISEEEVMFVNMRKKETKISKKIKFNKDNTAQINVEVSNLSGENAEITSPKLIWHIARDPQNTSNIKQIVIYTKPKTYRFKPKKKNETQNIPESPEWAGMKDQYFCSIYYASEPPIESVDVEYYDDQSMMLSLNFPSMQLLPGETKTFALKAYYGPQNYNELKKLGYQINRIVYFGFFHVIGVPLYYTLRFFYSLTKNYGLAIILLTLLIRIILWWPTQKSYSSMKKMQTAMNKMQPRLKTLKEIYKNDAAKLNEETMKLYKEYQINPMGGCLPMLLQMPVFFALYSTLVSAVELKGAEFAWFWKDLSSKDPYYVLPFLMGITMFIQQKISTPPAATPEAAAQQKMMLYFMPAMLTFFAFVWPSGLLLYWVVSNILSIGQQLLINRSR
jgi:YidC/Oxa1 family membrane protein insertase